MQNNHSIFGKVPKVRVGCIAHPGQDEITKALQKNFKSENPAAIIEVIASRGWGKTLYLVTSVLMPFLHNFPGSKVMWVAPTYSIGMTPVDDVLKGIDENTGEPYFPQFDEEGNKVWEFVTTKAGPIIKFYNGSVVYIKSAENPEGIVSKGFNLIIMDEAALIQEQVYTQQILGTARKHGIKIFIITSPRGKKHWTYKIFLKGQDPNDHQYLSFQQPYTKNPFFNPTLAKLIKDIPDWLFRQEYLAEFIDDGDSVFKNLEAVFTGPEIHFESAQQEWSAPITDVVVKQPDGDVTRRAGDRVFIVAMDIAKSVDFTVITVLDTETGDLVYYRRMNKEDYRNVLRAVSEVCHKYNNADLIFDSTGVGQGLGDMLGNFDVISHPFTFTNDSKTDIVNRLIISIEYGEITLPNIYEIRKELSAFTYSMTKTGKISYNAPSGFHDDIVMSLAMANYFRKENTNNDEIGVIEEVIRYNSRGSRPRSIWEEMDEDD